MTRYFGNQLITLMSLVLVASFLIFGMIHLAPGDPLSALLGNRDPDPARVAQLNAEYHLDEPFLTQYRLWLGGALHGDFGTSTQYQTSVSQLVERAAPVTLWLVVMAEFLVVVVGVSAAAISARFRGVPDAVITLGTSVAATIPTFVVAVVLAILLTVQWGIFPPTGAGTGVLDRFWHLMLPATCLAIVSAALLARIGRAAMREEMQSKHVLSETARGVSSGRVFRRHVLRNSAPPMLAVVGLQIPGLIAGAVVVEQVFNLGGLGSLLLNGVNSHDYPIVQAVALIIVVVTVVTAVGVDVIHSMLDPRVRIGTSR